jgi:hypothetical protein
MKRLAAALGLLALLASPVEAADDEMDPDRPDVASSARTVGRGRVQVESGIFARTRLAGEPTERRLSPEAMLRLGVTDAFEVRVAGEPIVRLRGAEDATDVGDFWASAKWQVFDAPDGSRWPALARPTSARCSLPPSTLRRRSPSTSTRGGRRSARAGPSGYFLQALTAASLSREIAGGVTAFGEVFYGSRDERDGRDQVGLDTGIVWKMTRDLALDVGAGTSLYGRLPDVFVRAGGSMRFGR